ncbi:hypothetical protein HYH03_006919 [Edaphochlamys debaryana]|uniref:Bulb-type lectin domain-containing protein n=1 Tax=Edaphochlamys debaryana TaxID=47281 RepID=A0A835Y2Y8_9CHLO|nr:hypothetical protein HYH03_006919 [Edaphochlamys debaryana]|eukprot:KAG2494986.1 hypothetical protein HYH03_006919 [Edaphochlamys debaryana]
MMTLGISGRLRRRALRVAALVWIASVSSAFSALAAGSSGSAGTARKLLQASSPCPDEPGYETRPNQNWVTTPGAPTDWFGPLSADGNALAEQFCRVNSSCVAWNDWGYWTSNVTGWGPAEGVCSYLKLASPPADPGPPQPPPGPPAPPRDRLWSPSGKFYLQIDAVDGGLTVFEDASRRVHWSSNARKAAAPGERFALALTNTGLWEVLGSQPYPDLTSQLTTSLLLGQLFTEALNETNAPFSLFLRDTGLLVLKNKGGATVWTSAVTQRATEPCVARYEVNGEGGVARRACSCSAGYTAVARFWEAADAVCYPFPTPFVLVSDFTAARWEAPLPMTVGVKAYGTPQEYLNVTTNYQDPSLNSSDFRTDFVIENLPSTIGGVPAESNADYAAWEDYGAADSTQGKFLPRDGFDDVVFLRRIRLRGTTLCVEALPLMPRRHLVGLRNCSDTVDGVIPPYNQMWLFVAVTSQRFAILLHPLNQADVHPQQRLCLTVRGEYDPSNPRPHVPDSDVRVQPCAWDISSGPPSARMSDNATFTQLFRVRGILDAARTNMLSNVGSRRRRALLGRSAVHRTDDEAAPAHGHQTASRTEAISWGDGDDRLPWEREDVDLKALPAWRRRVIEAERRRQHAPA